MTRQFYKTTALSLEKKVYSENIDSFTRLPKSTYTRFKSCACFTVIKKFLEIHSGLKWRLCIIEYTARKILVLTTTKDDPRAVMGVKYAVT